MTSAERMRHSRGAFTFIELVAVLAIAASLGAMLLPLVQKAQESAARTQCGENLRRLGLAVHNFEGKHKRLPPLYGGAFQPSPGAGTPILAAAASAKFPGVYGSVHVFLLPYLEQGSLYDLMDTGSFHVPDTTNAGGAQANFRPVAAYVCPADPGMNGGIVAGGRKAGTSYAANAQLFAPLARETLPGPNNMFPITTLNWGDRGSTIARIDNGSSNTIMFLHTYAVCGAAGGGAAWGETAGAQKMPSPGMHTSFPWQRSSLMNQVVTTAAGAKIFNDRPQPFDVSYVVWPTERGCDPTVPSTPHAGAMLVGMADASVRVISPTVSADAWNKACLPNDRSSWGSDNW